jgi:hypothetical protein
VKKENNNSNLQLYQNERKQNMKIKINWVFILVIGVMFIGTLAFVPADVRAESNEDVEGEYSMVEDGAIGDIVPTKTNTTVDLVTPCRIVDTRNAVGYFSPGQRREYYVYGPGTGPVGMQQQGGNLAGCPAPRSEPKGVIINVTVVPLSGLGNFRAFPANVGPPNASLVNYRAGVQNIANAASVETYELGGPREIEFLNSNGFAHLIVDVMGYYD